MNGFTPKHIPVTFDELLTRVMALEALNDAPEDQEDAVKTNPAFETIWEAWPVRREDGKFAKGNKSKAFKAFKQCAKKYPEDLLVEAAGLYLDDIPNRNGFLMHVATFFGKIKQAYVVYCDLALEMENKQ